MEPVGKVDHLWSTGPISKGRLKAERQEMAHSDIKNKEIHFFSSGLSSSSILLTQVQMPNPSTAPSSSFQFHYSKPQRVLLESIVFGLSYLITLNFLPHHLQWPWYYLGNEVTVEVLQQLKLSVAISRVIRS